MSNHPLVVHKRDHHDVYVGRPSVWGNPFSHLNGTLAQYRVASREEAISKYREYLLSNATLMAVLPVLKGKVLACWCHPKPCHASVLAELANPSPARPLI